MQTTLSDLGISRAQAEIGLADLKASGAIVDGGLGRLQLARLAEAEASIARSIRRLLASQQAAASVPATAWEGRTPHENQAKALAGFARSAVCVITGGPGTGKTQTTRAVLAAAEANALRVACCAFAGKAARRMTELTGRAAATIHRTLGYNPAVGWTYNAGNPLPVDLVVVDESSMIDVELFARLLSATPTGARLVIVGDVDQLPSIGAGRVLHDLLVSKVVPAFRLTHIFRQAAESLIPWFAKDINEGRVPNLNAVPSLAQGPDVAFVDVSHPGGQCNIEPGEEECRVCVKARNYVVAYAMRGLAQARGIPAAKVQVIAAQKSGMLGTESLNTVLQHNLNPPKEGSPNVFIGFGFGARLADKVMQTRNDYSLGVFNGEIGTVLAADPNGLEPAVVDYWKKGLDETLKVLGQAIAVAAKRVQLHVDLSTIEGFERAVSAAKYSGAGEDAAHIEREWARCEKDVCGFWYAVGRDLVGRDLAASGEVTSEVKPAERAVLVVDFGDKRLAYTKTEARALTLAYAITVHKAQGSSSPGVIFVCPENHQFMCTKSLVYTAVTRAERFALLVGAKTTIARAVRNVRGSDRRTTLQERLREPASSDPRPSLAALPRPPSPPPKPAAQTAETDDLFV